MKKRFLILRFYWKALKEFCIFLFANVELILLDFNISNRKSTQVFEKLILIFDVLTGLYYFRRSMQLQFLTEL